MVPLATPFTSCTTDLRMSAAEVFYDTLRNAILHASLTSAGSVTLVTNHARVAT